MIKSKHLRLWLMSLLLLLTLTGCTNANNSINELKETNNPSTEAPTEDVTYSEMQVHFLDVGQADCILIKSESQFMLVDAGNNGDGDAIVNYLREQGVQRLEYVIGTHPHEDHIGGMDTVINSFDIGKVVFPEKEHTTQTFEDVFSSIANKELKITKATVGDTYSIGKANFTIIAPNRDYGDTLNNWSVGINLTNNENSFLQQNNICKATERVFP